MKEKKVLWAAVLVIFCVCTISGCIDSSIPQTDDNRFHIVCTTFPQYDWTMNLIRGNEENVSLTLLMDKGADMHNFQPSALDIAKVSACELFIYVGGESDGWVDDALKEAVNSDMHIINMMDVISERLVEEDHVEGINGYENNVRHNEEAHGEHEQEYDEHVWLSIKNAERIVEEIAAGLSEMDSGNAGLYEKNCDQYISELNALDIQYTELIKKSSNDTLLFADRFPFRYLVEDYGLKYYAAFNGCSAETEASFETVAFLSNKLGELGLDYVIVLDGSDDRLAQVVIENAGTGHQQILVLNSLQSVSQKELKAGLSYLNAMGENLNALRQALQ